MRAGLIGDCCFVAMKLYHLTEICNSLVYGAATRSICSIHSMGLRSTTTSAANNLANRMHLFHHCQPIHGMANFRDYGTRCLLSKIYSTFRKFILFGVLLRRVPFALAIHRGLMTDSDSRDTVAQLAHYHILYLRET